ncbi:hypothetical protein ACTXIV_13140 [Psychrobacter celer]|uniref:hypothetical protein n=1 Tax=Psychrobacter celer TaxID=306572 RepID=UPI003FD258DD
MKDVIDVINDLMKAVSAGNNLSYPLEGVTLKSLKIDDMRAPNLDFFGAKSYIESSTSITLDFGKKCEAEIFLVFRTKEHVKSLDKAVACDVMQASEFYCDYEQNDPDWEFASNLSVEVTTQNEAIIEIIESYDNSIASHSEYSENGDTTLHLVERLAGQITEYFAFYMGDNAYAKDDDPALRDDIIKNLRLEANKMLTNAA